MAGLGGSQQISAGLGEYVWVLASLCLSWQVLRGLSASQQQFSRSLQVLVGLSWSWQVSAAFGGSRQSLTGFVRSGWILVGLRRYLFVSASLVGSQKVWVGVSGLGMLSSVSACLKRFVRSQEVTVFLSRS